MGIFRKLALHNIGWLFFLVLTEVYFVAPAIAAVGDFGSLPVSIKIESGSAQQQTTVPVTIGHVFSPGHVAAGQTLRANLNGSSIPIQVDAKATHADGSLRHAVLTMEISALDANQTLDVALSESNIPQSGAALSQAQLLAANFNAKPFDAVVKVDLGAAGIYQASAREILNVTTSPKRWLQGPLASEWILSAPLKKADGTEHPHLTAHFNVRAYRGLNRVKVDVVLENGWSFVPAPDSLVYDLTVTLAGEVRFQRTAQSHWHHARWIKTFWLGGEPSVHVRHDKRYLIATHALPNYDTNIVPINTGDDWNADPADVDIMKIPRFTTSSMGDTGAQPGIGPLPRWAADYLLSMDANTKRKTIGMSELAGSWSIHYRDQATGLPISILDPTNGSVTIRGSNSEEQTRSGDRKLERCNVCDLAGSWDVAHLPSFSYLPYIVTGDYYHLEELQFWADMALLYQSPGKGYREYQQGLLKSDQIRGQAWGLRAIAEAAYISPDDHPLKAVFSTILHENALYYQEYYLTPGNLYSNNLGVTMSHSSNTGTQTWMDDFLTWSTGHMVELGFDDWLGFWKFKSKFPIGRIIDDGFCWAFAAPYLMGTGPDARSFFNDFAGITTSNGGAIPGNYPFDPACPVPDGNTFIQGDSRKTSPTGYAANMQPAMAVAVDAQLPKAAQAWERFYLGTRLHDYAKQAQFAIVPRSIANSRSDLIVTVWAVPNSISKGDSTVIYWSASSGASCWGSGGWSLTNLANNGSQSVAPAQTSDYTVSCQVGSGTVKFSTVQIAINEPASGNGNNSSSSGNNTGNTGNGTAINQDLGTEAGGSLTPWLFALLVLVLGRKLAN